MTVTKIAIAFGTSISVCDSEALATLGASAWCVSEAARSAAAKR